jgi:hypothetical protein
VVFVSRLGGWHGSDQGIEYFETRLAGCGYLKLDLQLGSAGLGFCGAGAGNVGLAGIMCLDIFVTKEAERDK